MNKTINKSPWTEDEDRTAMKMRDAGSSMENIGERFGRTGDAVRNRLRWISLSIEERQALSRSRNRRQSISPEAIQRYEPSQDAIDDRNRRALAERSITAAFFGDPEPGRSALCKREGSPCMV